MKKHTVRWALKNAKDYATWNKQQKELEELAATELAILRPLPFDIAPYQKLAMRGLLSQSTVLKLAIARGVGATEVLEELQKHAHMEAFQKAVEKSALSGSISGFLLQSGPLADTLQILGKKVSIEHQIHDSIYLKLEGNEDGSAQTESVGGSPPSEGSREG